MYPNRMRVALVSLFVALLVVSGALVGCSTPPASTTTPPTGTSVTPSTGTSEGAEGDNVQSSPNEETGSVEATTVP